MVQRLSRITPHLRRSLEPIKSSPCRQFCVSTSRHAKTRMNMRQQNIPAQPSLQTAQSQQMKNMNKSDVPEELGMLRITYVLPPAPSILQNPRLRLSQYYEVLKQYPFELLQSFVSKIAFWRGIPLRQRPSHLKKHPIFRSPRINLDTFSQARILKSLHERSYRALQTAVTKGDFTGIRETCGTSLTEHYSRMVRTYTAKREIVKWDVSYAPWPFAVRILSRKFGQTPMQINGVPIGSQQVVARVRSEQTLTPGRIVGKLANGEPDVAWGTPKKRKMVETVVMQRKYVNGEFDPWKIFGFQSPKGTKEELHEWRESQLRIPGQPA